MATLLYNTLKAIGELPQTLPAVQQPALADAKMIAPWAKDPMDLLANAGILRGSDGRLHPLGQATRAELAQLLYNILTY